MEKQIDLRDLLLNLKEGAHDFEQSSRLVAALGGEFKRGHHLPVSEYLYDATVILPGLPEMTLVDFYKTPYWTGFSHALHSKPYAPHSSDTEKEYAIGYFAFNAMLEGASLIANRTKYAIEDALNMKLRPK
jgi:hypothetical protein